MNIKTLDGKIEHWNLSGYTVPQFDDNPFKSGQHLVARKFLREMFPITTILEEVPIPLRKGQTLYLDFYIPLYKMGIEIQGEQHFRHIPYFHHTKYEFIKAKKRDEDKEDLCKLNGITLIKLNYNESIDEWKHKII